jgi:APA family basic amino acid/polyamine antiporter
MTPQLLGDPVNGWARDPVAGIAANLPSATLQSIFAPLVSILAATILITATNAGLLGISRLTYNLSSHHQLPATLGRVHHRFRTPYIALILFSLVAILLLTPGFFTTGFFENLGALYVFGSLLCFALAHAAIIRLRVKRPDLPRPFKLRGNIKVKNREMPITAILGLIGTSTVWVIILAIQPFSRWAGIVWMAAGFLIYYIYRRKHRLSLTHAAAEQGGLEKKLPKK